MEKKPEDSPPRTPLSRFHQAQQSCGSQVCDGSSAFSAPSPKEALLFSSSLGSFNSATRCCIHGYFPYKKDYKG